VHTTQPENHVEVAETVAALEAPTAKCPHDERWTTAIDVHPFSWTHDAAQLLISAEQVAQHLAIGVERSVADGRTQGRQPTPEREERLRDWALNLRRAVLPAAHQIVHRLEHDLNRWFAGYLEYHQLAAASADDAWMILEKAPVARALELLSLPTIQDHIARFRRDESKQGRLRLKRAFSRLAVAPAKRGAKRKTSGLSASDRKRLSHQFAEMQRDVKALCNKWKGERQDSEAVGEAMTLVRRYCPLTGHRRQTQVAQKMLAAPRPKRAVEPLVRELHPELTITTIRELLPRTDRRRRTK
jgi:hypothetical protein